MMSFPRVTGFSFFSSLSFAVFHLKLFFSFIYLRGIVRNLECAVDFVCQSPLVGSASCTHIHTHVPAVLGKENHSCDSVHFVRLVCCKPLEFSVSSPVLKCIDRMNQPIESSTGPATSNESRWIVLFTRHDEAKGSRYEEIRSVLAKLRDGSELQVGGLDWTQGPVGVDCFACFFFCGV